MTTSPNAEQAEFWTHGSGLKWVEQEAALDAALAPGHGPVLEAAAPLEGADVLDIGCGTGATARALARQARSVHGVDISDSMLAQARASAQGIANLSFELADAQTADLGKARYDRVTSRFGVMFFADPVAAFRNIHAALKPGGRLAMACWGPFKQNPWFTIPRFAATDRLGHPPPFDPRAPGPFAFADTGYALGILRDAGFTARVSECAVTLTPQGGVKGAADLATRIGPAQSVLREMGGTEEDFHAIRSAVETAFTPYAEAGEVRIPACVNLYTADP